MDKKFLAKNILPEMPSRLVFEAVSDAERKGVDVLHLYAAPWWPPAPHIVEAVYEALKRNIYPPADGLPDFKRAIMWKLQKENRIPVESENEILVTNGAMQGLFITFKGLINHGDEILLTKPGFFYHTLIDEFGGRPVFIPLDEGNYFRIDIEKLEKKISQKTKMMVLCNPENPVGTVYTLNELKSIADLAEQYDFIVVSDESYEKFVYDGKEYHSFASISGMKKRTITIQSFTKSYGLPGWRMGYVSADQRLTEQFKKILEWINICSNYLAQKAAEAALLGDGSWVRNIKKRFEDCRNLFYDGISRIGNIECVKPEGGPFLFPKIDNVIRDSKEFSHNLLYKYGVVSFPGAFFGSQYNLRIPFGGENDVINTTIKRLEAAVENPMK